MIRAMARYFGGVSPVFVDGMLYVLIALFVFCQSYFGSDEAAKYVAPALLFWINGALGAGAAAVGALKMFRSSTYSDYLKQKQLEGKDTGP